MTRPDNTLASPPYESLSPDTVIDAVESLGLLTDMRQYPLNSYENRVYQVGVEDADPVIVKFYRPLRWSDEAIREEHQYSQDLADLDLPAVAPFKLPLDPAHTPKERAQKIRLVGASPLIVKNMGKKIIVAGPALKNMVKKAAPHIRMMHFTKVPTPLIVLVGLIFGIVIA